MVENKYLVNNKISSQYFVIYPLLAMTEVKRFLYLYVIQKKFSLYVRTPSLRCNMCLIEWSVRSSEDVFRSEVEMG